MILHLQSLEKQARAGKVRGFFQIPKFPEDPELCPVRTLSIYFGKVKVLILNFSYYSLFYLQVSGIRGDKVSFFVSYVKPHRSVTNKAQSQWIKCMLTSAGVDNKLWAPHAMRSASSVKNLDLGQICHLADWSMTSNVFLKFYHRYV